ncbi:hypothetical protein [Kamptonema formosum]|uniref:hypothetical protein n=1 Tax=Kamptonema formosum TaxID=331992 RepID=UPI00034CCA41|nr:hypothetical protein [Oscillatoria sp. PCC 10802]
MANITISDLRPAGSDLFADSESFMQELTEQEIGGVLGGDKIKIKTVVININIGILTIACPIGS